MSYNLVEIGKIGKFYGTNGEMRIRIFGDFESSLVNASFVFIDQDGGKVPYAIESVDLNKPKSIKLDDIDSVEDTHSISERKMYLRESEVIPMEEEIQDGYFFLRGFTLFSDKNEKIGLIDDVWSMDHHDLAYVSYNGNDIYIPLHQDSIIEINDEDKTVFVEIVDGLLDL